MVASLRKYFMIMPLALGFSVVSFAQTAAFEGTVKGPDGKTVPAAEVRIERQDVKGNYKVKTDKKGHYFYGGLPLGQYKISVYVDNQERANSSGRAKVGETQDVSFTLGDAAAAPVENSNAAAASVSAADKAEGEKRNKENAAIMAKNKALNDAFTGGKTAAAAGQWDAAIDGFTKAGEIDPGQHVVWGNLADSYASRAKAVPANHDADLQKSVEIYGKAIAIKDEPAYHNNLALVLATMKKFDEAQAELTKAATGDPTNAGRYYFNLGAVYVNTGNVDPAAAAFKKAIEADPNYADAYYQYGLSLMGKASTDPSGKIVAPPGTTEAFQKYIDLKPDGPYAQPSKDMMASLGATVSTTFSTKPAPANNQKKR
ncbi:MAG: tetratricopeptide repeat protein [Bryobacteraceae bacterium]